MSNLSPIIKINSEKTEKTSKNKTLKKKIKLVDIKPETETK